MEAAIWSTWPNPVTKRRASTDVEKSADVDNLPAARQSASDLAIANFVDGASVVLGDGKCGFGAPTTVLDGAPNGQFSVASDTVAIADIDGDGFMDVLASSSAPMGASGFFNIL